MPFLFCRLCSVVVRKAWEWGLEGASLASSGHKQQPGKAGVEGAPSLAEAGAGAVAEVPGGSLDEAEEEEVGITRSEILGQRRNLLARTGNLHMACVVDTRNNNLVSGWKRRRWVKFLAVWPFYVQTKLLIFAALSSFEEAVNLMFY